MAEIGRFLDFVQDSSGNGIAGVNVEFRRQGATVLGNQTNTVINVNDPGGILIGDTIKNYDADGTSETAVIGGTVTGVSATTITFNSSVTVVDDSRLSPTNALPTLYLDALSAESRANPMVSIAPNGQVSCWIRGGAWDYLVSGGTFGTPRLFTDRYIAAQDVINNLFPGQGVGVPGWKFDTSRVLTGTDLIAAFYNNGTRKASVQQDGTLILAAGISAAAGLVTSAGGVTAVGNSQIIGGLSGLTSLSVTGASTLTGAVSGVTTLTATNDLTFRRPVMRQGTSLVAGDFALSPGWGNTASVLVPVASFDSRGYVEVTCNGAGIVANPTVTLTFKDGAYTGFPVPTITQYVTSNDQLTVQWSVTTNPTTAVFTWNGTPVATKKYGFAFHIIG